MELWIRSQDKRHLIRADYVSIMANNIINVASSGWDYDVAKYKTEERALEILDEIQKIIGWLQNNMKDVTIGDCKKLIGSFNNYVYEIPQD